ncbi:hypothetical protein ABID59_004402 [Bradyrhizobium sp. S3.3.6]|uniref:hypothetical protein n=1 Tax=Bradyrhizobium sp. S3.3.6 TaxID=3156429 RepID=UPI003390C4A5
MPSEEQFEPDATSNAGEDTLILYGQSMADRVSSISSSYTTLLMSMGRRTRGGPEMLVPLVDVRLDGPLPEDGEPATPIFYQLVTLDNLAFVLEDMTNALTTVCQQLAATSSGRSKPDADWLTAVKKNFSEAKANLEKCLPAIESIG